MRFLGSKFTQNALAARAPPRIPLGELKRSPRSLADFRGPLRSRQRERRGKRQEGTRKRGIGDGKEGRKGREEGREGKGRGEGKRGEGEFASLALGGIDAPGQCQGIPGRKHLHESSVRLPIVGFFPGRPMHAGALLLRRYRTQQRKGEI